MSISLKNQLHLLWLLLIQTYNELSFFNSFPGGIGSKWTEFLFTLLRRFIFVLSSVGPIPNHVAFIMDGNRTHAKKKNLAQGDGYGAGFSTWFKRINIRDFQNLKCVHLNRSTNKTYTCTSWDELQQEKSGKQQSLKRDRQSIDCTNSEYKF